MSTPLLDIRSSISGIVKSISIENIVEVFMEEGAPLRWNREGGRLEPTKEPGLVWQLKVKYFEYPEKAVGGNKDSCVLSIFLIEQGKDKDIIYKNLTDLVKRYNLFLGAPQ